MNEEVKRINIKHFWSHLPLTKKMLLLTILVGLLVWLTVDYFVKITVEKAFVAQMHRVLDDKAREGRYRFRRHIFTYFQAVKLFSLQKNYVDYINKQLWKKQDEIKITYHKRSPKWFVKSSLLSNFINPRYALLIDPFGKVREVYKSTSNLPPQSLLKPSVRLLQLVSDDISITKIEGIPYLITAKVLIDQNDEVQAILMLASPFDTDFLLASQGGSRGDSIMALVNDESENIFASSDIFQVPIGTLISTLNKDFVVIKQQSLDYGNSEINFRFTSLVPKSVVETEIATVVNQERLRHAFQAFIYILIFVLILLWIITRISNLTKQVVLRSQQVQASNMLNINHEKSSILNEISETRPANDEIGSLISGFNNMLLEINQRDNKVNSLNIQLRQRALELNESLENLKITQKQMLESEKMASLGSLVAGVAHEINTPVGVGVLAASALEHDTKKLIQLFQANKITRSEFANYLNKTEEFSNTILFNLKRAANLISSFKKVSVDQFRVEWSKINVREYLVNILVSLRPKYHHLMEEINIDCPDNLIITTYPGSFAQIISNLLINSIEHAFNNKKFIGKASINIKIWETNKNTILIKYQDNGCGMNSIRRKKIFEPFYTTRRFEGGTGLGLSIAYNLITQQLGGQISCKSTIGKGTSFLITIKNMQDKHI
jgi:signal transduction histidine kinase